MKIDANIEAGIDESKSVHTRSFDSGLEGLSEFASQLSTLERTLCNLANALGGKNSKSLRRLHRNLEQFEPSVTFLGQVKSGKTSLVSALAGWPDLLPSDVNPWTSVVTSLHLQPGPGRPSVAARFSFMSEAEWNRLKLTGGRIGEFADRAGAESDMQNIRSQIDDMQDKSRRRLGRKFELLMGQAHEYGYFDKNLLERYICLGDDIGTDPNGLETIEQGQFADITRSADLFLNTATIPCRLCLRDTPGVNDTFMMREQVTIGAIRDSKICVVVLSASQALTSVDMGLIRLISNIDSRELIIFVNRIDELSDPANQVIEIESSIRKTLQTHRDLNSVEVLFGSAFWANRALSGDIDSLGEHNSNVLLKWAETALSPVSNSQDASEMVWELSGLPALLRAITSRIVENSGRKTIRKTAMSAVNIATAQQATHRVSIEGCEITEQLGDDDIKQEFERILNQNIGAFEKELDTVICDFCDRADRAQAAFVANTSRSLLRRLEHYGADASWDFKPDGLRMLLRSAYKVMGNSVQSTAGKRYERAVSEIALLLHRAFGNAVEGIQIGVPLPADIPPPVTLGQTLALDFNDRWWTSWWHHVGGFKVFANRFEKMVFSETEHFMDQLKIEQSEAIKTDALNILKGFFVEQRHILTELMAVTNDARDIEKMFMSEAEVSERKTIKNSLLVLQPLAA